MALEPGRPMFADDQEFVEKILNQRILFGLRAQEHLPTIRRMLADGASWEEIGKEIGWDAVTAREHYGWEVKPRPKPCEECGHIPSCSILQGEVIWSEECANCGEPLLFVPDADFFRPRDDGSSESMGE